MSGINATVNGIMLPVLQNWTGHGQLGNTGIHPEVVGKQKQDIAAMI